ncbi:unnamed protein product [Brachionus calyciflorus]|uniref:Uncharacterized protein n=1 Tax=Brachionus calyciflorus TaxID=104777 RepID=A0A814PRA8_9BILA|nr:unnamed protein product [Brachionus calyciflorus]
MRENKSTKWTLGLKFVQLQKNHSHHSGIKCTPYKALFGIETPLGLSSTSIPIEEWSKLSSTKQLFETVGYEAPEADLCPDLSDNDDVDVFNSSEFQMDEIGRQAEAIRTRSKRYVPDVSVGDYVALPIPDVDRGLSEAPNLVCRIVDIDHEKSLYQLACEAGLTRKLSVRQAVREISIGGDQGMSKCNCTGGCLTNRCSCKKSGLLCNSRCHGANSNCKNK